VTGKNPCTESSVSAIRLCRIAILHRTYGTRSYESGSRVRRQTEVIIDVPYGKVAAARTCLSSIDDNYRLTLIALFRASMTVNQDTKTRTETA